MGIVGDLECTPAGALGQAAPRVGLNAPGYASEQKLLVIGSGLLAEDLAVLFLELGRGQATERLDLLSDLGFCLHGVNHQ
ncbi:MAG: hypothetical protein KatS3mg004_2926 [Bryobacteraceae bacterium]|nr:MAG: hypothetical protein KatS3mg004_2926 [Bryobacteraceae bacterium]